MSLNYVVITGCIYFYCCPSRCTNTPQCSGVSGALSVDNLLSRTSCILTCAPMTSVCYLLTTAVYCLTHTLNIIQINMYMYMYMYIFGVMCLSVVLTFSSRRRSGTQYSASSTSSTARPACAPRAVAARPRASVWTRGHRRWTWPWGCSTPRPRTSARRSTRSRPCLAARLLSRARRAPCPSTPMP